MRVFWTINIILWVTIYSLMELGIIDATEEQITRALVWELVSMLGVTIFIAIDEIKKKIVNKNETD